MPRELRNLLVFVLLSSKNENNNGFASVGLNSLLFDYMPVVFFHFVAVFCIVFSGCLFLDWIKYLRIERHLAAKFGTFSAILI